MRPLTWRICATGLSIYRRATEGSRGRCDGAVLAPGAEAGALALGAVPDGVDDGETTDEPLGGATGEGASNDYGKWEVFLLCIAAPRYEYFASFVPDVSAFDERPRAVDL